MRATYVPLAKVSPSLMVAAAPWFFSWRMYVMRESGNDRAVDFSGQPRTQTVHAPTGNIASLTDELGNTITFTYTPTTAADGFVYYDLASVQFGDGRTYAMSYDTRGNRTSMTAPGGAVWTTTYNARGQQLNETSALGGVTGPKGSGLVLTHRDQLRIHVSTSLRGQVLY